MSQNAYTILEVTNNSFTVALNGENFRVGKSHASSIEQLRDGQWLSLSNADQKQNKQLLANLKTVSQSVEQVRLARILSKSRLMRSKPRNNTQIAVA